MDDKLVCQTVGDALFHPPPSWTGRRNVDVNPNQRVYISAGEVSFVEFLFLPSWFAKLLETNFSCFAKIR
jgi:hypothetical protein